MDSSGDGGDSTVTDRSPSRAQTNERHSEQPSGLRRRIGSVLGREHHPDQVTGTDSGRNRAVPDRVQQQQAAACSIDVVHEHRVELDLDSDRLTMTRIAAVLSDVLGVTVSAPEMNVEQALAAGMPAMGAGHESTNIAGQPADARDARDARAPGDAVTDSDTWARENLAAAPVT